ncbi:MAG TPA: hypothetical protein VHT73_11910 [Thermodesulfobacteriota bacterium]|nr:hypothetical protein [Thermodesulfobacteriota bacterium]
MPQPKVSLLAGRKKLADMQKITKGCYVPKPGRDEMGKPGY